MHPQNAVEMSAQATRLSACAQPRRRLLKGVSCLMCRSRAGSECAVMIGSSNLKVLAGMEQVLCRYVIAYATIGNSDFPNKISEVRWVALDGLTNMTCPVAVQ